MSEILPNAPVVFEDRNSMPHWGVALSPVIPQSVDMPWPHVLIRVIGLAKPIRVPARDVAVWLPGVAVLQARAATS